ncbi:MAG: metallophosphoesterase [Actinobacteria bacterium]|nr:metallophosphoesterase [Actinomycetota bacterium]
MALRSGKAGRLLRAWPLIMVLVVLLAGGVISVLLPTWIDPRIGIQNDPRITRLIYPTLGNPAIIEKGGSLVLEFDPREQDFGDPFTEISRFEVKARSSNGPGKVTKELPVRSQAVGYSSQWPEYARAPGQDRRIYLVTVTVPRDLPHDLYDVSIEARAGHVTLEDTQPHSLEAVDAYKDDFTFIQLTDVHVWGPEISYPGCTYQERSARPNGTDPKRKGAVYYQKAIDEINITRPDFCILSGDCIFGQRYFVQDNGPPWGDTTEYQYEMLWFYRETLRLDVPVYIVMGNHDSYNEGQEGAREDWYDNWRKLYGPLYHSFDYGAYHFVASNSQDWSAPQRELVDWEELILQPKKYKGELLGGGDKSAEGITAARLDALDDSKYTGQLAWIRDDLKAHQSSKMRVMVMHHDPYKKDGSGEMWGQAAGEGLKAKLKFDMTKLLGMGDGEGRLAIIRLMQDYRVALEISGHDHSDYVATRAEAARDLGSGFVDVFTWTGGGGEVKFVNTTSTQFQSGTESDRYPGYRKIHIVDGRVESFNYKEPKWSYPWYKDTNAGGITDLGKLTVPAISEVVTPAAGASEGVTLEVRNWLDVPLPAAYREVALPYLSGGYFYTVEGGAFGEVYENKGTAPDRLFCQVLCSVPPLSSTVVSVRKSAAPDSAHPAGTVVINGGAKATGSPVVTLALDASDAGGAGIRDMMISNTTDFEGAVWEPYRTTTSWTLPKGGAGMRTVYVKFRDAAMPGNESPVVKAEITYEPGD